MQTFDEEVLQIAESNQFLQEFAHTEKFGKKKYFIHTKFHKKLESWLLGLIDGCLPDTPTYMSGIQGIGKTTTLLYFVLERLKQEQNDFHYIDLNLLRLHISKHASELEKFEKTVCDFERKSFLIIDHATLDNVSLVEQMIKMVEGKQIHVIVMETGFTASKHYASFDIGKAYQLDEVEFISIWNGTLGRINKEECTPLLEQGKAVYSYFAKKHIITPRLLNFVLYEMLYVGRTLEMAGLNYQIFLRNKIETFSVREDDEVYSKFCLDTRILLHHVHPDTDCIFPYACMNKLCVAINIFDVKEGRVTKDDLENDIRFKELGFDEGDAYIRLSHLTPAVAVFWQQKLPYDLETILMKTDNQIFEIMFQYGGARKEFEELLVHFQKEQKVGICPGESVCQTNYEPSATYCELNQTSGWYTRMLSGDFYMSPTKEDLSDIDTEFQGFERNVARCAILLRKSIEKNKDRDILLYPQIGNFMGVDYFLFLPLPTTERVEPPEKMFRFQKLLHLVSTGATHGETIGKALTVIKKVFSGMDITIHVVIIIAKNDAHPYRLQKCKFENVSVINLTTHKNILMLNGLLYKFTEQLAKVSS